MQVSKMEHEVLFTRIRNRPSHVPECTAFTNSVVQTKQKDNENINPLEKSTRTNHCHNRYENIKDTGIWFLQKTICAFLSAF